MFRSSAIAAVGHLAVAILLFGSGTNLHAADAPKPGEPTDAKARKTFDSAVDQEKQGNKDAAIALFLKTNGQDGGNCTACLQRAFNLAWGIGDYKTAESILRNQLQQAETDQERARLHLTLGMALQRQGIAGKREQALNASCDEFKTALQLDSPTPLAHYEMGISLAYLHRDDAARAEFATFLREDTQNPSLRARAARFTDRIDLARTRMAPQFAVTTLDGQHISTDSLEGKVVLIDFWATWCGPCIAALPHVQEIAREFRGQPFVLLSIDLDKDAETWKEFVSKNQMTWPQYRDGYFDGPLAAIFGVTAAPATFSIDSDGVLDEQHLYDPQIDDKLKKLVARAAEANGKPNPSPQRMAAPAN